MNDLHTVHMHGLTNCLRKVTSTVAQLQSSSRRALAIKISALHFHVKTERFLYIICNCSTVHSSHLLASTSALEPSLVIQVRKDLRRYEMQMPSFIILFFNQHLHFTLLG